jgi:hypothetical protein
MSDKAGQALMQASMPIAVLLLTIVWFAFDLSFGTVMLLTIPTLIASVIITGLLTARIEQSETHRRGYWRPSKDGELQFPKDPSVYQRSDPRTGSK